jgi:hypothetical protein
MNCPQEDGSHQHPRLRRGSARVAGEGPTASVTGRGAARVVPNNDTFCY